MCYRVLKTPRMIITSPVKAEALRIVLWGGKSYLCLSSPSWEQICTPPPFPTPAWVQTLGADPYRRAGRTWAPAPGFEAESCLCPWRSRPWLRQGFWACKTKAVAIPLLAVLRSVAKVTRGHVFHRFLSVVCQTRVGWVR